MFHDPHVWIVRSMEVNQGSKEDKVEAASLNVSCLGMDHSRLWRGKAGALLVPWTGRNINQIYQIVPFLFAISY